MITKETWMKRKERYGKSGCKNPEERKRKISEHSKKEFEIRNMNLNDFKEKIKT